MPRMAGSTSDYRLMNIKSGMNYWHEKQNLNYSTEMYRRFGLYINRETRVAMRERYDTTGNMINLTTPTVYLLIKSDMHMQRHV